MASPSAEQKYLSSINEFKDLLEKFRDKDRLILSVLQELKDSKHLTVDVLKATGIGMTVNGFRKHEGEVGKMANELVSNWKNLASGAVSARKHEDALVAKIPHKLHKKQKNKADQTASESGTPHTKFSNDIIISNQLETSYNSNNSDDHDHDNVELQTDQEGYDNHLSFEEALLSAAPSKSTKDRLSKESHKSKKSHKKHSSRSANINDHTVNKTSEKHKNLSRNICEQSGVKDHLNSASNSDKNRKHEKDKSWNEVKQNDYQKDDTNDDFMDYVVSPSIMENQLHDSRTAEQHSKKLGEHHSKKMEEHHSKKSGEHRSKKSGEHHSKKMEEHLSKKSGEYHSKKSGEHHSKKMEEHHSKKSGEHHSKKSGEHRSKKSGEHRSKKSGEHHPKKSGEHHPKKSGEHHSKESGERHSKKSGEHHYKNSGEHHPKKSGEHHSKKSGEHLPKESYDQPSKDSDEQNSESHLHKKHKKDKHKKEKHHKEGSSAAKRKHKESEGITSTSGQSFEDLMAYSCPVPSKKKKVPNQPTAMSSELVKFEKPIPATELLDSLPELQTTYKPLPRVQQGFENRHKVAAANVADDDDLLLKANVRTAVYSGKKRTQREMLSLYQICLHTLMNNIDSLGHVGGVPYGILKPVLEKCTAVQLFTIEDYNPEFTLETDELWKVHCNRDFKGKAQKEYESWRELYLRLYEERENKLEALTARIAASEQKKIGEAKKAKVAYVAASAPKPPRDVLRKQIKYGTGSGSLESSQRAAAMMRSESKAMSRSASQSKAKTIAAAPLMKKTMKFISKLQR